MYLFVSVQTADGSPLELTDTPTRKRKASSSNFGIIPVLYRLRLQCEESLVLRILVGVVF